MLLASRYGTISSVGAAEIKALVSDGVKAYSTTDGTNWTSVSFTTTENQPTGGWINDDLILFAGNSTDEGRLSTDGGASYADTNIFTVTTVAGQADIGHDGTSTLAVSSSWTPFYNNWTLRYSTDDGSSWSTDDPNSTGTNNLCWRILYDGSQWVLAGSNGAGNRVQSKTTLGTGSWTGYTTPFANCNGFDYDGTTYIFGVNGSSVYTTTDLTTYTARSVGATVGLVAHGDGVWVAVGYNGTGIYRSTNSGVSWSLAYTAATGIRRMKWSPSLGLFIATSSSGNVFTSSDGSSWSTVNVGSASTLWGIATR